MDRQAHDWFWRVFCLIGLLLPMITARIAAAQELPGVQGGTYESPLHQYRVSWDTDIWTPSSSASSDGRDTLLLQSDASDFQVHSWESDETPNECAEVIVSWVRTLEGAHTLLYGPENGTALIRTLVSQNGSNLDLIRRVDCVQPFGTGVTVRFIHYSQLLEFERLEVSAAAIRQSLHPVSDVLAQEQPPGPRLGLLETETAVYETGITSSGNRSLTVTIVVRNVDEEGFPSEIDANRIIVVDAGGADDFIWQVNDVLTQIPAVSITAGQSIIGAFTWTLPSSMEEVTICYVHATDQFCTPIATISFVQAADDGSVTGGGSGSRPRIDPGR